MHTPPRLRPGSQVRCPHCRRWHLAIRPYTQGTDYTVMMMFVCCGDGLRYYVGQEARRVRSRFQRSSLTTLVRHFIVVVMPKDWRARIAKVKRQMFDDLRRMSEQLEQSRRKMVESERPMGRVSHRVRKKSDTDDAGR